MRGVARLLNRASADEEFEPRGSGGGGFGMSSGFNTDIRVGEIVFHVQTEDRGPSRPVIDTAVYQNGRVLHRRSSNYAEFAASPEFTDEALRQRVEQQHRAIIEELRSGALAKDAAPPAAQAALSTFEVQLINTGSWLSAGNVTLDVEVVGRADRAPLAGVQVEARILGSLTNVRHTGTTDDVGRVHIQFPLPPLGKGDLALVICAVAEGRKEEIRFEMRSRAKAPAPPAKDPAPGS